MLRLSLAYTAAVALFGQFPGMSLPPSGNNQKASVTQFIGPVKVTIDYSSPSVHGPDGRDRHGEIWGKLVPYGLSNLGFGNGKPGPWRAGANENTVFAVSNRVLIEGKPLEAGRYGLHMIPGPDEWTLIFSKNSASWGSFFYDPAEDALRVTVKPKKHEYREWLTYEFPVRRPSEATVEMQWEDLAVGWNIQVQNGNDIYLSRLKDELTTVPGFSYQGYLAAVNFCLQNDFALDQALQWADAAISMPFVGQATFSTLSAKAQVLNKLKREAEAKEVYQTALKLPSTTSLDIHMYGRQLLSAKKTAEAVEVFEYNAKRNGDIWPVHVGLARAYAATGDTKKALEHAKLALPQAPDELNRKSLEGMIQTLSEGKTINQ